MPRRIPESVLSRSFPVASPFGLTSLQDQRSLGLSNGDAGLIPPPGHVIDALARLKCCLDRTGWFLASPSQPGVASHLPSSDGAKRAAIDRSPGPPASPERRPSTSRRYGQRVRAGRVRHGNSA